MKYEEVYQDWEYLWSIGPAFDMTGGYIESDDLMRLLKSPTKTTAKSCLEDQIRYWFEIGPDIGNASNVDSQLYIDIDSRVAEIAERYGVI